MADPSPPPPPGFKLDEPSSGPPPPPPGFKLDQPSWLSALGTSLKHGATDLFYGGAQLGARMGPEEGGAAFADPADLQARQATVDKVVKEREKTYRADPSIQAYPKTAFAGDIAGQIGVAAPFMALPGAAPTLPARMIGGGLAAIPIGAARPVADTSQGDYGTQKAEQIAGEVVGSAAGQAIGEKVIAPAVKAAGRGVKYLLSSEEQRAATKVAEQAAKDAATKEKATAQVQRKVAQMTRSGRYTAGDVMQQITEARAAGQPLTLLDVDQPGGPVRRLGGTVYRGPGEAGAHMEAAQEARTYGIDEATQRSAQGQRLEQGIRDKIASTDAGVAGEQIAQERSAVSKPLWDRAMEGGSVAPLEHQFGQEFEATTRAEAAAQQRVAEANTKLMPALGKQQTASNVYSASAANQEQRAAQSELTAAENELERVRTLKEDVRTRLQQAQADGTANAKGAVWSPQLQVLLDNPRLKAGLSKGWQIERDNANAEGRPINAREYAIVGTDENGDPIVGKVPNMKLIQMAKEGLDGLLEEDAFRDKFTRRLTKEGQGIDKLRRALLAEGDRLNPDWKAARDAWAGPSARLEALNDGKFAMSKAWSRRDFAERWNEMNGSEREVFKIGVADKMIQDLDFARLSGDQAKAMINNTATRDKLRLMFGPTEDGKREFNQFLKFVTNERTIWETGNDVMRGSQTAAREAADEQGKVEAGEAVLHAAHGTGHLKVGNILGATRSFLRAATHLGWGRENPAVNLEVAKILTDPSVELRLGRSGALEIGPQPPPTPSVSPLGATARGTLGRLPSSMYYAWPGSPPQ
jgi:hypothetical protein